MTAPGGASSGWRRHKAAFTAHRLGSSRDGESLSLNAPALKAAAATSPYSERVSSPTDFVRETVRLRKETDRLNPPAPRRVRNNNLAFTMRRNHETVSR